MFNAGNSIHKLAVHGAAKGRAGQARLVRLRWVFWARHNVL